MDDYLYVYPVELPGNDYLENNKKIWMSMGYEIKGWKEIFSKIIRPSRWKKDILILNFFENMPLYKPKFLKFIVALIFLFIARLTTRKIVWIRHNFNPHEGYSNVYYKILLKALEGISSTKIAHRHVPQLKIDRIVQHPLYNFDTIAVDGNWVTESPVFMYFGVIKEYKGIPELVSKWPENVSLNLYGKCTDAALINKISAILENNKQITWHNEFLVRDKLDDLIAKADYIVIPHIDNSMIVSGAIFHAMSLGTNLLIKDSSFAQWCVSKYPFIKTYNSENIVDVISKLDKTNHKELQSYVNKTNSPEVIKKEWSEVFNG
ncbi:hypothetical protein VLI49_001502 [Enterobacter kobei]|uniref:hypothetical protein n=1 Tax=Enterobacter kobei TaxID=208224 RepID=UPI001F527BBE|nr:hypothetical protein [Enterobacter kobei]EMC7915979.1 hypothetical protein [Enterobacter kobei]MCH4291969.1 hypothetical protein [Enterobacter kobei]